MATLGLIVLIFRHHPAGVAGRLLLLLSVGNQAD